MPSLPSHSDSTSFANVTFQHSDMGDPVRVPSTAGTLDGFREWALSDDFPTLGRITFVDGELIIDMSPESVERHNDVKSEISRVLLNLVRAEKLGKFHVDGVLISNPRAQLSNEPDAVFLSRETLKSDRVRFTAIGDDTENHKEIVGSVDWVLEVVSPSSKRKDKVLLRKSYYNAGIGEYWLVDALGDRIEFEILVPGDDGYQSVQPQDGWRASPTFGKSFRMEREVDEDGFQLCTLHMR